MSLYPTHQLRAFVEVAAQGSFTRAAERLGVSQPTASQLVRTLEDRIGTPLFVRRPRRIELTPAGRALLPHAEQALALDAEAQEAVDRAQIDERTRLLVGAGEALATYVLPAAVAKLKQRLPRLQAGFVVGTEPRVLSALRTGEVDAALLTEHTAPADIETVPYADGRSVLIVPPEEPDPKTPIALSDLAGRTLVQREMGTVNRREVDQALAAAGVEPASRLEASSLEAVKRCVEAGLGVAIVPNIAVIRELELGTLRELPMTRPVMECQFCLAWRRGEPPNPAVQALLAELSRAPSG
jgi:DNA-binding transcriptional LysR family regulator